MLSFTGCWGDYMLLLQSWHVNEMPCTCWLISPVDLCAVLAINVVFQVKLDSMTCSCSKLALICSMSGSGSN